VFVCENNFYAIHTHRRARQAFPSIHKLAAGYGIPSECIEECDPACIYDRVRPAVDRLRSGGPGPYFFECLTYRWKEHVGPNDDFKLGYRTPAEAEPWKQADALGRLAGMLPAPERRRIEAEVEAEIAAAVEEAEQAPFPNPDEIMQHVFKES
jgi:TPP-dependent pyruvate/acetoin dehydrogenase alpha subunit